jgi:uncharacterized membrane protein YphA (DoxX/SURF4 family)
VATTETVPDRTARIPLSVLALPLRLFIGVGWLRAGSANISTTEWRDGDLVERFVVNHETTALPFVRPLLEAVSHQYAAVAWIVAITEIVGGVLLLSGRFLRAALVWCMGLNLVFLAAGQVNPSIFYLFVQAFLLTGVLTGALGRRRPVFRTVWAVAAPVLAVAALALLLFIDTIDGEYVIRDPAAVLALFCGTQAVAAAVLGGLTGRFGLGAR